MPGLDTVPRENWPPVPITFWSFRIMVGMGLLMFGLGLFSLWCRWRGTLFELAAVACLCGSDGTGRLRRRARGLDHHRDRTATTSRIWPQAFFASS